MNLAMKLTLDGLVRALRMQAQQLAEDVELPVSTDGAGGGAVPAGRIGPRLNETREGDDDSRRG
jgi:hypothetical protein